MKLKEIYGSWREDLEKIDMKNYNDKNCEKKNEIRREWSILSRDF